MFGEEGEGEGAELGEKVEEFERVEDGWTGPRERRERAKSGSEASRLMAGEMVLAWCVGRMG